MKRIASCLALALMVGYASPAFAQSAADKAAADALFEQGKKLVDQGKFSEACPKFAESVRLDGGLGTMLRLADCYEKNKQTASAWIEFREAASLAARKQDNREKFARRRAAELEAVLPKLMITLPKGAPVEGMEISRDGEVVSAAILGTEVPIDPGSHTINVSAPDKAPWTQTVVIEPKAAITTVAVPPLEAAGAAATPPPAQSSSSTSAVPGMEDDKATTKPDAPPPASGSTQRTIALVVAGVGVVGLGIGAVMGLNAKSDLDASNANGHCRTTDNHCDATGVGLRDSFQNEALVSTIGFVVGGAALAGAAALWFLAPKEKVVVAPAVGMRDAGLVVRGVW